MENKTPRNTPSFIVDLVLGLNLWLHQQHQKKTDRLMKLSEGEINPIKKLEITYLCLNFYMLGLLARVSKLFMKL